MINSINDYGGTWKELPAFEIIWKKIDIVFIMKNVDGKWPYEHQVSEFINDKEVLRAIDDRMNEEISEYLTELYKDWKEEHGN